MYWSDICRHNLLRSPFRFFYQLDATRGRTSPPRSKLQALSASDRFRRALEERRIENLKGFHFWISFQHIRQGLQYLRVPRVVVSLRVLFGVPEAIGYRFRA